MKSWETETISRGLQGGGNRIAQMRNERHRYGIDRHIIGMQRHGRGMKSIEAEEPGITMQRHGGGRKCTEGEQPGIPAQRLRLDRPGSASAWRRTDMTGGAWARLRLD